MITKAPILAHYKQGVKTIMETDSSDYVSSRVLSQLGDDRLLHPVAFFSKNLNLFECNYEIYEKELLAIIRCFELWRPELEGTKVPVKVITDHKSLEYFMTTKKLTRRQAHWAEFLSEFNFVISSTPGKENQKADSLTRRPNDFPSDDNNDCQQHLLQLFFLQRNWRLFQLREKTILLLIEWYKPTWKIVIALSYAIH